MWSRFRLLGASLSLAVMVAAGLSAQAVAGGNGAGVVRDGGQCLASNNTGFWVFSCSIRITFGPTGSITQSITGSVIPEESSPLPSKAITNVTGGPCLQFPGGPVLTTVVAGVVTPSGQVQLTCKS